MVINTNIQAEASADNLQTSQARLSKSLERLSSGSKIVSPADDAGGLAVSMSLDAQVLRTDAALSNVSNALSFLQTQDGYLQNIGEGFNRMSQLAILAQDSTKTDTDRSNYDAEFQQLVANMVDVSGTKFNGVRLFSTHPLEVTIDADGNTMTMNGVAFYFDPAEGYSYNRYTDVLLGHNLKTAAAAAYVFPQILAAIDQLGSDRGMLGAYQERLNYTAGELSVSKQNLVAANSGIRDVDVAEESTEYAKENILVQSGTAMLAQANQSPKNVLKLLE